MTSTMMLQHSVLLLVCLCGYVTLSHTSQWGVSATVVEMRDVRMNSSARNEKIEDAIPFLEPIHHQTKGRCRCLTYPSIQKRYNEAYQVVRARVIREWSNGEFTFNGRLPQNMIMEYRLQITAVFKGRGLKKNAYLRAQTFRDPNMCGLRLRVGQLYLLNLDDPSRRSAGSFWKKGYYELHQCQFNYQWTKINAKDIRFLIARSK